jgi:hypothetical protein
MEQEPPLCSVDGYGATAMYFKDVPDRVCMYYCDIHAEAIQDVLPLWPSTDGGESGS